MKGTVITKVIKVELSMGLEEFEHLRAIIAIQVRKEESEAMSPFKMATTEISRTIRCINIGV